MRETVPDRVMPKYAPPPLSAARQRVKEVAMRVSVLPFTPNKAPAPLWRARQSVKEEEEMVAVVLASEER